MEEPLIAKLKPPAKATNFKQIFAVLSASIGTFSFGIVAGWSSPALPQLEKETQMYGILSIENKSWISSVSTLGGLTGCLICGYLINKIGRKWTMVLINFPVLIGWLLIIFSWNVNSLIIGRYLSGFAGGSVVPCILFLSEISQVGSRGRVCLIMSVALGLGVLFTATMSIFVNWSGLGIIGLIFPILQLLALPWVPDTSYSNLLRGKKAEGKAALKWFRGTYFDEDIQEEFVEIQKSATECLELRKSSQYSDILDWKLWKPCLIPLILIFLQQFCGIFGIAFNSVQIFQSAGPLNPYVASAILSLFKVSGTIGSGFLIDRNKFGRRFLLLSSCSGSAISIFGLGLFLYLQTDSAWLPITCLIIYVCSYTFGLLSIPWIINAEVSPPQFKGFCQALGGSIFFIGTFIVTKEFEIVSNAIELWGLFWVYAAFCIITGIYVYFFVPETNGFELSEIQRIYF